MNNRFTNSLILGGAVALLGTSPAMSAVLVSTGLEGYPSSGAVAGVTTPAVGDVGIASGTWAGANWSFQGTGLSYTDSNGTINGGSRALDYTGSNSQHRQVNALLTNPIAETVYIRFLADFDGAPTATRIGSVQIVINNDTSNNNNNIMPGFGMIVGGPDITNGTNTNQFYVQDGNSVGISTTVAVTHLFGGTKQTGTNMIVAKLTHDGTKFSTIDFWANPEFADLATPTFSTSLTSNITSLTRLVARGGASGGGPRPIMDEIVFGTAWSDVVINSAVIPEPASLALLAGVGTLMLRRRG